MTERIENKLSELIRISITAGLEIMDVYNEDFSVDQKEDNSPLTQADKRSNETILKGLKNVFGDLPFISEETRTIAYSERKNWKGFWLIDPLDGTKEFVKKNGEFTVNIAWVENNHPLIGVVHAPATGITYAGIVHKGAFCMDKEGNKNSVRGGAPYMQLSKIKVVGSRSHLSPETLKFVDNLKMQNKEIDFAASGSSLKLCMVAEGSADVYPRFGPTMEWDTAAAHAVVQASGKQVLAWPGLQPLTYNKEDLLNPWFIVQ